ncbi:MAG: HEAT repeat domain-containing protein, partial [Victivallales bacterium]
MLKKNKFFTGLYLLPLVLLMPASLSEELSFDENGNESPEGFPASLLMSNIGSFGEFSSWNKQQGRFSSKFVQSFRDRYKPYISWEIEKSFRKKYFMNVYDHNIQAYIRYLKKYPSQALLFSNILFRIASIDGSYQEQDSIRDLFYMMGEPGQEYLKKLAKTPEELNFLRAEFRDAGIIPWLSEGLGKGKTRERAIFFLGEFGKDAMTQVPKLKRFYDDDDIAIKFGAMEAVLKISPGDEETLKAVKDLCSDQAVHPQALKCLSLIPEPQSLAIILSQWRQADDQDKYYTLISSRCANSLGEKVVPVIIDDFKKGYNIRTCQWAEPYLLKYMDQAAVPLSQFQKSDDNQLSN